MAQIIKIKRGTISSLVSSTPTLQQGELLLATGSVNGLGSTFFVADAVDSPELPYTKVESISDGSALASSLDGNFEGLLIHSASDNKLYRYNGTAFVELPIAAGSFVGTLPVANGGTNATSFADKAVIISQDSGTDTLSALTLTTSGQLVIGGSSGPAAATLTAGAGIDVTNGDGSITIAATLAGAISQSGQVDHDQTTNFVANEHINHTSVSITAGDGLSGGGTIAATRTLTLNTGSTHFTEAVEDTIGGMLTGNTETLITVTYQDGDGTIDFVVDNDLSNYSNTTSNFSTITQLNASSSALQSNIDGKQDTLTFGIANTNAVKIDHASVADNDYAKFTATGLEGRSYSEVKTDLSLNNVENTALSTWGGSSNITTIGTVTSGDVSAILPAGTVSGSSQISLGGDLSGTANSATVAKVQGVALTSGEATQIANIGSTTISATQWGYLGVMDQNVLTTSDVTFASASLANLTVTGNASIQGTLTTVNSNDVNIGDRIITLNTADGAGDAGIHVHDTNGAQTASIVWDTDGDYWKVGVVGSTQYRLAEWDGEAAGGGDFLVTNADGRIDALNTTTAGDILQSDGDGTFTITNIIDGGTF